MIRIVNPQRFILLLIFILVVLAGTAWWGLWGGTAITQSGQLIIAEGESARSIWNKAVEQHYTERTLPWRYYAWRADASQALKAGTYQLEKGETIPIVINRMVQGETLPDELTVTYPEGFTLKQIAARTAGRQIGTEEEFIRLAVPASLAQRFPFLTDLPAGRTLEGYLFPDTYRVFADDTPIQVIERMLANFNQKFAEDLRQEAQTAGRTLDQIVTMASIIEREVIKDEDMALISGILWKRFDEKLGLDADATIRYAVDNWDKPLTAVELAVDSPYNTRRYRGLPPGPISNPGLRALSAAVRPEASEYYYYLSAPSGETIFAKTNDEHNRNKAQYLK